MSLNVDTDAFKSINRKIILQSVCSIIATYIINCYATPSRLFNVGDEEILSIERTTQGDPTTMGAYALGILPLIKSLLEFINLYEINATKVVVADNFPVGGSFNSIKDYRDKLTAIDSK